MRNIAILILAALLIAGLAWFVLRYESVGTRQTEPTGDPASAQSASSEGDGSGTAGGGNATRTDDSGSANDTSARDAAGSTATDAIRGIVLDPSGQPAANASVYARAARSEMRMIRLLESRNRVNSAFHTTTRTDAKGRFSIEAPSGETLSLHAQHDRHAPSEPRNAAAGAADVVLELETGGYISGFVVDDFGNPMLGVDVTLTAESGIRTMIAGSEGDFEFTNVALAPFRLDARAPGHHMVPAPLWEFGTEPRLENVRIVLAQSRQVFGFVFDPDGNPMQGAQAEAESTNGLEVLKPVRSDAEGVFRFREVRAGIEYTGRIEKQGYPGVEIASFSIPPGKTAVDIGSFVMPQGGKLYGNVVDGDGKGIGGAIIEPRREDGSPAAQANRSAPGDGRFGIRFVQPGRIVLHVRADGYVAYQSEPIDLEEGGDVRLEVTLDTGAIIEGRVIDGDGAPLEHMMLTAIDAAPLPDGKPRTETSAQAFSDATGAFRLGGLANDARYTIEAYRRGTGRAILRDVEPGTTNLEVRVDAPAVIVGTVVGADRQPVREFLASLEPIDGPARRADGYHFFDSAGRFRIEAVDPGPYRLTVRAAGHGVGGMDRLEVVAPETRVQVELRGSGSVNGVVVDSTGQPVLGATIDSLPSDGRRAPSMTLRHSDLSTVAMRRGLAPASPRTTTDGNGRFRLRDLPPGPVRIRVRHPEFVDPVEIDIIVTTSEEKTTGTIDLGSRQY